MSDDDAITAELAAYAEWVGDDKPLLDFEEWAWLTRSLNAGATRETAALAAGIADLEALCTSEPKLGSYVGKLEARAEVLLLAGMAESRPAFVLERTRPNKYGPTVSRGLEKGFDPDDDLFGGDG